MTSAHLAKALWADLMIDTQTYSDDAAHFHREVAAMLEGVGWEVSREVRVQDRGDGKRGRIDIVARKDGRTAAIELDCRSARFKSLHKLASIAADVRVVILRRRCRPVWFSNVVVFGPQVAEVSP